MLPTGEGKESTEVSLCIETSLLLLAKFASKDAFEDDVVSK